ncbi:MAG: ABC transporter permease [Lachnospiraceae bacterium]|nr:ABC transporter permease [Lachnospiraceae bacterium]
MKSIFLREMQLNLKQLLIWSIAVGGMGFFCIIVYQSMQADMKEMADAFSDMGAFSDAFGMSTLSIATLKGYFSTEVGTVHGLGGAMFAAILAIGILSKEEERHTGEFLLSLPVTRTKVITAKGFCIAVMLVLFTVICSALYVIGFVILGGDMPMDDFAVFMCRQLLMNMEVAAICFFISALSTKINIGAGLGIIMLFYVYDIIGRVVPDLKDYLFIGPYSYANASEIFTGAKTPVTALVVGGVVFVLAVAGAYVCYNKRDLVG